jgi:hypothetical protein
MADCLFVGFFRIYLYLNEKQNLPIRPYHSSRGLHLGL